MLEKKFTLCHVVQVFFNHVSLVNSIANSLLQICLVQHIKLLNW